LVFNWPQLPGESIREQYNGDYYVFGESPGRRWMRATQLYLSHLYPLEGRSGGRRLLEVGCARGELLAIARARGWEVEGIEISAAAAEAARSDYGLPIVTGALETHAASLGGYDVVIATDVIEHVTSPRRFVQAAYRVLCPGGTVVIETPNWGGFWRRVGRRHWLGLNRFHLFLFDGRSLRALMGSCGFADCRLGSTTNAAHARWGDRSETHALLAKLPAGLQWRMKRWLNGLTVSSMETGLQGDPIGSLDEAVRGVDRLGRCGRLGRPGRHLWGDNLVVRACRLK
jgi:2-polyprenyl-3-methyl-5-hydroxy-6-metoxy-1,4-benzoquinol methylase